MNNNDYATVLKSFFDMSSLGVAQVNTKNVSELNHLLLAKKWGIPPEKALNTICCTTQCGVHTVLHLPLSRQFIVSYCTGVTK